MVGQNIKRYRTLKGISLRKFGELVGLSHMAIKKYEQGELMPDGDKLIKFAEVLECKVSDLLKDNSNRKELNLTFRKRKILCFFLRFCFNLTCNFFSFFFILC